MISTNYMVAIGHWGQPSVVRLQAKIIRATCGDRTPILVSDDKTETAGEPERGARLKRELLKACGEEGLIYRDTCPVRLGHAGGDLGAFYHGVTYAQKYGIAYVVKLSQRLVIDVPDWLPKWVRQMKKGTLYHNTGSAGCVYGPRVTFHMRTECVLMETAAWSTVLESLTPRLLPTSTEHVVADICGKLNGGQRKMLRPLWLPHDRSVPVDGVCWKDNVPSEATDENYRKLFSKYGIVPGEEFNIRLSCTLPGHLPGIGHAP